MLLRKLFLRFKMKKFFCFLYFAILIWCLCQANEFDEIKEKMQKARNAIDNELKSIGPEVINAFETAKHENHELAYIEREQTVFNGILVNTLRNGFSLAFPGMEEYNELNLFLENLTLKNVNKNPEIWFLPSTIKIVKDEVEEMEKVSMMYKGILEILSIFNNIANRARAHVDSDGDSTNSDSSTESNKGASPVDIDELKNVMKKLELVEESLEIRQRGEVQLTGCIGGEQIKKFETYAKLVRLQDVHDAAIDLHKALEAFVNNKNHGGKNLFDFRQEANRKLVENKLSTLKLRLRLLLPKFAKKPIDAEMAERLVRRDETAFKELNEEEEDEGAFFTKLEIESFLLPEKSQNEHEHENTAKSKILKDKYDVMEWEMLVSLAHLLRLYFVVDKYGYLPAMYRVKLTTVSSSSGMHSHNSNLDKMLDKSTNWVDWLQLSREYVQNSPLVLENEHIVKLPGGFAELLFDDGNGGLYWQLLWLYKMMKKGGKANAQFKKKRAGKADIAIVNQQKLDKLVKMRTLIWPAILLHIALQHWYVEPKNVDNAEIVIDTYKVLNKVFKENGINKGNPIDKELAKRMSNCLDKCGNYKEIFGEEYEPTDPIKEHQKRLMVNIGRLLSFYYGETFTMI